MKLRTLFVPSIALGIAALLTVPEESHGYVTNGDVLGLGQRDIRLYNNFEDASANDSTATNAQFPGYDGAELAVWKSAVEWGSGPHGNGDGDPSQANLGDGGANFDASWQGGTTGIGGTNDNIASVIPGSDGGSTYAFAEGPYSNGWRVRFYENWTWSDNVSGLPFGQVDIQGIMTHEYGHCLGLGHTNDGNATMFGSTSTFGSINQRSINADDIAGIQDVYGVKNPNKPEITGLAIGTDLVTIFGTNFTTNGNDVWFTKKGLGSNGTPIKVTGVSSTNGGTQIEVAVPNNADDGDILVQKNSAGGGSLSNAFPFDKNAPPSGAPNIASLTPNSVTSVVNGVQPISIAGSNFTGVSDVSIDGVSLTPIVDWTLMSDNQIVVHDMPLVSNLSSFAPTPIAVTTSAGTDSMNISVVPCLPDPVLEIDDPNIVQANGVTLWVGADFGDVGVLLISTDLIPSDFGDFVLDIGNGGTTLWEVVNPLLVFQPGWTVLDFPTISGLPIGLDLHWQALILRFTLGYKFPWHVTNPVSCTITG